VDHYRDFGDAGAGAGEIEQEETSQMLLNSDTAALVFGILEEALVHFGSAAGTYGWVDAIFSHRFFLVSCI
jgi:hypothetical protein